MNPDVAFAERPQRGIVAATDDHSSVLDGQHRPRKRIEWDAGEVLEDVRDYVVENLGDPGADRVDDGRRHDGHELARWAQSGDNSVVTKRVSGAARRLADCPGGPGASPRPFTGGAPGADEVARHRAVTARHPGDALGGGCVRETAVASSGMVFSL
ncbi:hypothetical protein ABTY53_19210 [Streptomyces noursei]|uniref:hypothetical protein n=1 Tax=Streptomyces noursei TaxID=1971 RepID=UPI00332E6EF9